MLLNLLPADLSILPRNQHGAQCSRQNRCEGCESEHLPKNLARTTISLALECWVSDLQADHLLCGSSHDRFAKRMFMQQMAPGQPAHSQLDDSIRRNTPTTVSWRVWENLCQTTSSSGFVRFHGPIFETEMAYETCSSQNVQAHPEVKFFVGKKYTSELFCVCVRVARECW